MNGNGGYFNENDQNSPPAAQLNGVNGSNGSHGQLMPNSHFDVDQVGINFVLAYALRCPSYIRRIKSYANQTVG